MAMKNFYFDKKEAGVIIDPLTRKYLTGVDIKEGVLIALKDYTCFTDARYFSVAKPVLEKAGIKPILYKTFSDITDYLKGCGVQKVYLDYERTTVSEYERYKKDFLVDDCSEKLSALRAVKSQSEIENIRKACEIAQKAYYNSINSIKKGMTERELKDILEQNMLSLGATGTSFDTIVAFGANGAVPHHETGDTVLCDNMGILVDMGCVVNGYCSDITRTAFFGKPSDEFVKCYNAVKNANEKAIEKITHKTTAVEADGLARKELESQGLAQYFTHSLGHGVGLEIHESPTLSQRSKQLLKNDMVFTIEPGVYIDGVLGIRIEDTVILSNGKVERLYTDSKELLIIK